MPAVSLSSKARAEYAEAAVTLRAALSGSPFAPRLVELGAPLVLSLLLEAQRDEFVAERLAPLRFTALVRAALRATQSEECADRLISLHFAKVPGIIQYMLASDKAVARLSSFRVPAFAEMFEEAARYLHFAEILQLHGFREWVNVLERAPNDPAQAALLPRLDFYRLRRAVLVTLGLARVATTHGLEAAVALSAQVTAVAPLSKQAALTANPFGFDFMWAVRCLQIEHRDRPKVGRSTRLADDFFRLRQEPDLRFAPSTIRSFAQARGESVPTLSINFLGMFGPNGALPLAHTVHALDRLRERDDTLSRFADVFHHRFLSHFFRAWAVHQKTVDLDRAEDRRFANYTASAIGLGQPTLRDRDAVPDLAKLYFAGRLGPEAKNAEGLEAILGEFFGIPCEVRHFQGHWITIPPDQVCRLGSSPDRCSIGSTAIVGSSVYQYQTKFRLRLGPMRLADLQRLLPSQAAWRRLKAWVRNYLGDELLWDAQYILLAAEVPPTQLGGGALLGWTTWVTSAPPSQDAEDVIIDSDLH